MLKPKILYNLCVIVGVVVDVVDNVIVGVVGVVVVDVVICVVVGVGGVVDDVVVDVVNVDVVVGYFGGGCGFVGVVVGDFVGCRCYCFAHLKSILRCARIGCVKRTSFIIGGPDVVAKAGLCEGWAVEPEVFG